MPKTVQNVPARVGDHTQNTSLSSVVTLSNSGADGIMIQAIGGNVRVLIGGAVPTSSFGWRVKENEAWTFPFNAQGEEVRVIEETASTSIEYQFVAGV